MADTPLPFSTRIWFAWACFFRVLFDGAFAARAFAAQTPAPELPPRREVDEPAKPRRREASMTARETPIAKAAEELNAEMAARAVPALQMLAILQREGRLIDFLEQDVASFDDADVGAAARAVHEGCRKALRSLLTLAPLRSEDEGAKVTLHAGFSPQEIKLTGDVKGSAPYIGALKHRGWRATDVKMPTPTKGHDASIVAPAEVEL